MSLFTDVDVHAVIPRTPHPQHLRVPLLLERAGLGKLITHELDLTATEPDLSDWQELVARIALRGRSRDRDRRQVHRAARRLHQRQRGAQARGGLHHRVDVKVRWIGAEHFERVEPEEVGRELEGVAGVLVPGGFGYRAWRA